MTYLEELRQSKDKAQVAFQEFALSTREFPNHLFCFFEGKDNAYYVPRIKRFTDKYHPVKCGGRDKVLEVYRIIVNRPEYGSYKKAFFIDRDFNQILTTHYPPIFETPCYSIENLYISIDIFQEILTNEFHLSKVHDKGTFDLCSSLFIERLNEFHNAVRLLNAWYSCLIDLRNSSGIKTGVNLDDKLPKELYIDISLQSVTSNYNFEKIRLIFPSATDIEENILNAKLITFQNCNGSTIFRGKYEMQFLIKFIQLLLHDSNSSQKVIKNKIHFPFGDASGINNEQAINIFEGYAETPESLIEYLRYVTDS